MDDYECECMRIDSARLQGPGDWQISGWSANFCHLRGLDYRQQIIQQDEITDHMGKGNIQYLIEHMPFTLMWRYAACPQLAGSPALTLLDSGTKT